MIKHSHFYYIFLFFVLTNKNKSFKKCALLNLNKQIYSTSGISKSFIATLEKYYKIIAKGCVCLCVYMLKTFLTHYLTLRKINAILPAI